MDGLHPHLPRLLSLQEIRPEKAIPWQQGEEVEAAEEAQKQPHPRVDWLCCLRLGGGSELHGR